MELPVRLLAFLRAQGDGLNCMGPPRSNCSFSRPRVGPPHCLRGCLPGLWRTGSPGSFRGLYPHADTPLRDSWEHRCPVGVSGMGSSFSFLPSFLEFSLRTANSGYFHRDDIRPQFAIVEASMSSSGCHPHPRVSEQLLNLRAVEKWSELGLARGPRQRECRIGTPRTNPPLATQSRWNNRQIGDAPEPGRRSGLPVGFHPRCPQKQRR